MENQHLERRLQQLEAEGSEYVKDQRLILSELKRFNEWLAKLDERVGILHTRLTMMEVKAGMWGALAGSIPFLIAMAVSYFKAAK